MLRDIILKRIKISCTNFTIQKIIEETEVPADLLNDFLFESTAINQYGKLSGFLLFFPASTSSSIFNNIDRYVDKIDCECTSEMIRVKLFFKEKKKPEKKDEKFFFKEKCRKYATHFVLSSELIDMYETDKIVWKL